MDSIKINAGEKKVAINDDPNRVIVFNPDDRLFIEKFYSLMPEIQRNAQIYEKREAELLQNQRTDEHDLPVNFQEVINLQKEACMFMREKIDYVFGAGTSQVVFGDALNPIAIIEFVKGISPFIMEARADKIAGFNQGKKNKRVMD